jgi:hypothetical protein
MKPRPYLVARVTELGVSTKGNKSERHVKSWNFNQHNALFNM